MPAPLASTIVIQRELTVDVDEITSVLRSSTLGERRPIDDPDIVRDMVRHSNLLVTAREAGRLIAFSRSLTDFSYVAYLADLAVDKAYQRGGIGRALIAETRRHLGPRSMIVLRAAPAASDYYPAIGFEQVASAWILRASNPLT
jgi:predicted N-acetyltransferase YhbS